MNCGYPFFTNNLIKLVLKIHLSNHWLLFVVKNPNPWIMAGGRPCGRPFGDHLKLQIPQWALKRTNPNKRLGSMGYNPLMSFFVFFFTSAAWVESSLFQFEIYIYTCISGMVSCFPLNLLTSNIFICLGVAKFISTRLDSWIHLLGDVLLVTIVNLNW
jgi:hypothetical protein